jgi:hypothetical protein
MWEVFVGVGLIVVIIAAVAFLYVELEDGND